MPLMETLRSLKTAEKGLQSQCKGAVVKVTTQSQHKTYLHRLSQTGRLLHLRPVGVLPVHCTPVTIKAKSRGPQSSH